MDPKAFTDGLDVDDEGQWEIMDNLSNFDEALGCLVMTFTKVEEDWAWAISCPRKKAKICVCNLLGFKCY